MRQNALASNHLEAYRKRTRKERFLQEMEQITPWRRLGDTVRQFYPAFEAGAREPALIDRMLRIYFLQYWFNLSDAAAEETLYDSHAMRAFVGIDLSREPVPEERTIRKFREFMEERNLGDQLLHRVNVYLKENGLRVHRGMIIDASIISASPRQTQERPRTLN